MIRWIARLAALCFSASVAAAGVFLWGWHNFTAPGPLAEDLALVVPQGAGVNAIAAKLEEAGVIADKRLFAVATRLTGDGGRLRAGEYLFPAAVSGEGVVELLKRGEVILHRLTVPEGLTVRQIVALVTNEPLLTGAIETLPPEGSLLPDTYLFSRNDSRADILARMEKAMNQAMADLWPNRAASLPLKTPEEAVVLASIVERETALAAERPRVASVFINRLRLGMRLQSDPTTIYGLSEGLGVLDRALTRKDLAADHPFNTYVIDRLPPSPIACPGRESLAAVLNPASTKDLYFVADGSGGHAFARTLAEHNRNVAQWRRLQRRN